MAEQRSRTIMNKKEELSFLVNLFILFYTIKHLWKLKKRKTNDLYRVLFPSSSSTGGNKTLYDSVLRLKDCNIAKQSKRLSELTGIDEKFFTGERRLPIQNILDSDWSEFIALRRKRGSASKDAQLRLIEDKIKAGIAKAAEEQATQNAEFKKILYFAEYGHKRSDKILDDLFREIESKIAGCLLSDFEQASLELLESHQRVIQKHLIHIDAVVKIKKWADAEK